MADWGTKSIDTAVANRDVETLADLVRADYLSPEARSHLADVLKGLFTGRVKFPKRRPPKRGRFSESRRIAERVWETKKTKRYSKIENAIDDVAEQLGCSAGKVWTCWRDFDPARYEHQKADDAYWAMYDAAMEYRAEAALESLQREFGNRAEFSDEEIETAAQEMDEAYRDYDD
jgi:hypothetical protein